MRARYSAYRQFLDPLGIVTAFSFLKQAARLGGFSVSKNRVIPSQCAHWRGNLPDFRTFISHN